MVIANSTAKKCLVDTVGTVDRAIRERNIYTEVAKMPDEIETTLLENGWIGKKLAGYGNGPSGGLVLSLHKNMERVKTVAKRYESGLVWTDAHAGGVDWQTLHPSVLVNRFPRDHADAVLKLCGRAMAGRREHDDHYPRAYATAAAAAADDAESDAGSRFAEDYSLTACASLLLAFADGDGGAAKYAANGQIPFSTLHFAMSKCNQYITANGEKMNDFFTGKGPEWEMFFKHYYKIVHDNQKFAALANDKDLVSGLMSLSRELLEKLSYLRPQSAMDGYKNMWVIKSKQLSNNQPLLLYKIEDILEKIKRIKSNNYIVQKYVENPLLINKTRFNLQTWIVISTVDKCLTIWIYHTCCMQFHSHKYSVHIDNVMTSKLKKLSGNSSIQTCNLKQLKRKLRSMDVKKNCEFNINLKIKKAIVMSVLAAADVLNLRPNCFELFRATFVIGNDLNPWLIDIKSDPWTFPAHTFNHAISITNGIARNLAKMLVSKDHVYKTKIGMFDLIHKSPIPGNKYQPRAFIEKPISKKKCDKTKIKTYNTLLYGNQSTAWDDSLVSTYIEQIQVNDIDNHYPIQAFNSYRTAELADSTEVMSSTHIENKLCLVDLKESMARLKAGSKINVYEAKHCLQLLDKWKTRVMSVQRFYKNVIAKNNARR